jgi:hypothetical protein
MAHILSAVSGTQADVVPVTRALISVSDKSGIVDLCTYLHSRGVELLSTGGTARALRDAGLPCVDVSEYTGSPECLDGRVKTLHPKVHGGLLGVRGNPRHERDMRDNGIGLIDMTVLNLYPFEATVRSGASFDQCIENVDIGGPSMLRSTAKNHAFTTIVTCPTQYDEVRGCMERNDGGTTLSLRKRYAARAFALSAAYDSTIAAWFGKELGGGDGDDGSGGGGAVVTRVYKPEFPLKYGEWRRVGGGASFVPPASSRWRSGWSVVSLLVSSGVGGDVNIYASRVFFLSNVCVELFNMKAGGGGIMVEALQQLFLSHCSSRVVVSDRLGGGGGVGAFPGSYSSYPF